MSPRPTARYPNPSPRPGPRRQLPNEGVAKNGELLGPKVKAQLALEARGHVCVLGHLPRRERRVSGPHRQLPNEGVAKNGELLGPKVKAQLALEARGHVPNADDSSSFVRNRCRTSNLRLLATTLPPGRTSGRGLHALGVPPAAQS